LPNQCGICGWLWVAASPSASEYRILEYPYSGDCSCMDMPWLWEWPYPSGASSFALACLHWIMLCTQWTQSVFFSSNSTWEMLHSGDIVLLSRDKKFQLLPCLRRKKRKTRYLLRKFSCAWQANLLDITKENCQQRKNLLVTQ